MDKDKLKLIEQGEFSKESVRVKMRQYYAHILTATASASDALNKTASNFGCDVRTVYRVIKNR